MAKPKNENELRIVRVYNAPAKLIWEFWTKDEHVQKWWGPRGFSLTTKSKDIRPGGKWIYTMHGPDGVDYPNITTYHEVEKYSRLVYDHGGNEERQALFRVTMTLTEIKGKTTLDMTMGFESAEAAREIKKFIKKAGGESTWDRLAEYVDETQSKKDIFVINRSFKAPRKTVFEMWVNTKHFANWMGPTGSRMEIIEASVLEGGRLHYVMDHPSGDTMYGMAHYKKIQPYDLLIYSQNFCDKAGKLVKPSFAPTWPDSMLTTVQFFDEGDGETRITLQWEIDGAASEIERNTFHAAKAGMTGGWTGSFDKLEEVLSSLAAL